MKSHCTAVTMSKCWLPNTECPAKEQASTDPAGLEGSPDAAFATADPLHAGLQETSPDAATSPRACSSPVLEMNTPNLTPVHDGDFTPSLLEESSSALSRGLEQALGVCWLSSPNWAHQGDAELCSLCTTPSLDSPLSPPSPFLSGGDGSFSWETAVGVGMLMQGSDVGDEQMRLFSILCYCAMAPELETLPTSFPLLLNTGVGTTICIVIYKHCKTLLGPTCINLAFALAFFFPLASLQHSVCLCCMSVRLSSAETEVLLPRASVCIAAILLSSCSEGRAVGTSC